MNELKRYKPVLANTGETPWPNVKITEAAMQESETGGWVRYEDVNKIRAQAVRDAVDVIIELYGSCIYDEDLYTHKQNRRR